MDTDKLNSEYIDLIKSGQQKNLSEMNELKEELKISYAAVNLTSIDFLNVPKMITREIDEDFKRIAEKLYSILEKVIKRFLSDADFRKLFGFSELEEKMMLSECRYPALLPVARVDLFYNEQTKEFKFCEFNTDGSSGMLEEMQVAEGIEKSTAFKEFVKNKKIRRYDLFEGLIDGFSDVYASFEDRTENPVVCITDFMESGVSNEFEEFRSRFEKRGFRTFIADIRELKFDGNNLYHKDTKIDAVYRRAVTGEMIRKQDQIPEFISAVMSGKICVIGHIRTQAAHVKKVFSVLHDELTMSFLDESEREFVRSGIPYTAVLNSDSIDAEEIKKNKSKWVIKPSDLYASKNVTVGYDTDEKEWEKAVDDGFSQGYLLQEFIDPFKTRNCYYKDDTYIEGWFGNIIGLYLYNGKYGGLFTRAGTKGVISAENEGFSLGSMVVEEVN